MKKVISLFLFCFFIISNPSSAEEKDDYGTTAVIIQLDEILESIDSTYETEICYDLGVLSEKGQSVSLRSLSEENIERTKRLGIFDDALDIMNSRLAYKGFCIHRNSNETVSPGNKKALKVYLQSLKEKVQALQEELLK